MKRKGFTLIELLAVIAILAVILVISVPLVISNIDKGKQKSYDNQVALFVEGAKRYAVEYIDEIKWEAVLDDEEIIGKFDIKLQYLADQGYVDLPVINSKTGDPFDPENTIVTVYKLKNGDLNFEFEGNIRLTVGSKLQYILRTTVFDKKMIMNDVKAFDKNKNDITSSVSYSCRYKTRENGEDVYREVDCNELANENKQLGTYVINYSVKVENKVKSSTKTVEVVEQSSPEIVIRPETDNVESVRVTIVYPNGSKNNIYSSKSVSGENYKGSFEINENQTIIANCTDKYGLKCKTAERVITNIKPTIEGMITIAADWPNATSMKLALSGVNITRGNGKIEYKCKVGTKETAWSESPTCNITGLTEGTAYTVVAYARNKDNTMDVIEKKPVTIYTAKMVKVETKTLAGTCPTNNNIAVAETDIYEAATVTGTCSQTMGSTKVSSKITNSEACGAAKTLTYTYSGTTYSGTTTSTCTATSSSCISKTSYYACSRSSWSAAGCSKSVCISVTSLSGCSVLINSARGCSKIVSSGCSVLINSASGCSSKSTYGCTSGSYVANGCSTIVGSTCTVSSWSTAGCTQNHTYSCTGKSTSKCSSNSSYSCQVLDNSCSKSWSSYCSSYTITACSEAGGSGLVPSCYPVTSTACSKDVVNVCKSVYKTSTCTTTVASTCTVNVSSTCTSVVHTGCYVTSTTSCSSTSYYGCNKPVSSTCTSTKYYACSRSSWSAAGCTSTQYYACSRSSWSASGCTVSVCSSSLSRYGCSILINSSIGCSKQVCESYKSYYTTTYMATITYPKTYTVTYKTVLVKPKQKVY